ncbi:hypothetical protein LCGC14_0231770 [marine sediment metagenome]|uniref:Uncharacterized protein n=1 Tax=marine sediment metagenome TaxID=412755 RepID=A0A0F9UEH4_9ZZZZ
MNDADKKQFYIGLWEDDEFKIVKGPFSFAHQAMQENRGYSRKHYIIMKYYGGKRFTPKYRWVRSRLSSNIGDWILLEKAELKKFKRKKVRPRLRQKRGTLK